MPLQKFTREEVISRLLIVFRLHGYEGSSLAMIAQEVGLQKASLYHLFPGGKEEMAQAVLASVGTFLEESVLRPLRGDGSPSARLETMIAQVREFYQNGQCSCLFDTLSVGGADNPFRKALAEVLQSWVDALAALARENGSAAPVARQRAERVLVTIQGTLILSRCLSDPKVFTRGLQDLPEILLS